MRCFCCAESAESEMVLPAVRDRDDAAPISKAAIGSPTLGPTRKAKTFQVDLLRDETRKYGLDVSAAGKVCMVNSVQDDSLVADLNKALQEKGDSERIIRPFDRLLSFNGKEAPQKGKEVMEMLRNTHGSISILVQRPFIHKVVVEKTVDQLGISKIDGSTFLLVTNISDARHVISGMFSDWVFSRSYRNLQDKYIYIYKYACIVLSAVLVVTSCCSCL
ncbi:unnamed protein product [Cladocopium goreaui]|uniref:PDZ domain-containing protein n=1 Tax=Cladocopium goreaui TaxID=2562237 RepID=A0A9P1G657_9DINO|nr:unnamed protein product [Cladocopium goreaui]